MTAPTPATLVERFRRAKERRAAWETHWREAYDFALPQRAGIGRPSAPGEKRADRVFDGTAPDAVDQLAASLVAELTPPWAQWFGFEVGTDASDAERGRFAPLLERTAAALQSNFDRSNFAVEIHQCYLDLVTAGTASLLCEEAPPGEPSAFRFTAVPLSEAVMEEGPSGLLDTTFRRAEMPVAHIRARYPDAELPRDLMTQAETDPDARGAVIEAVVPDGAGFAYTAVLEAAPGLTQDTVLLAEGRFPSSPFINFRWQKAPGEVYGRSPVMKALPDIKTANKVVELVLKNATIAVTGIWQADDDGVLNPATVKLTPGTIIPKAVGSSGLTPLAAPGRFDTSEIVLDDLRRRIKHALLVDKLGQVDSPRMTATEVLERAAEMARLLGATYGRLQAELLAPLVSRTLAILVRRGEVDPIQVDGRAVALRYKSPLARDQARQEAQATMTWLQSLAVLGPEALGVVDAAAAARWLARAFGVPADLVRDPADAGVPGLDAPVDVMAALTEALAPPEPAEIGETLDVTV